MAHIEQREFCESVKSKFPEYFKNKKVLDIGSLDINGSNRDLFEDCDYIGIDVGEGKNVDIVSVGHLFDAPDNTYDVIISTEVFEHDMFYEKTVENIIRMLKPSGLFLFTCAAPGRPEHGTLRQGEWCAPLLLQVSKDWANYYKNLTPEDFKVIPNFNETFENQYFEIRDTDIEFPSDLYFYGFKKKYKVKYKQFTDDVFIIDCWPDNHEKEQTLIKLIESVKVFGCPIILCGHYPIKSEIQKLVDYYIFDNNNDLLYEKDFVEYGVFSDRWSIIDNYKIINKNEFHHDYAIWITMKNAFNLAKQIGKKYIHFLEYDNLPDEIQYRQGFMEYIRNYDAVVYEYSKGSTLESDPYSSAFIFSVRTEIAEKFISLINSKEEYFKNRPNRWQLEKVLYQSIKKITNNIFVSKYIPNNNELNIFAAWNRNGIDRNGATFQTYLATDNNQNLYIHFISGFTEKEADKDYLVEITYCNKTNFFTIKKQQFHLLSLGKYKRSEKVKIFYQGVEVFSQELPNDYNEFHRRNQLILESPKSNRKINVNFIDGPFLEILDDINLKYHVKFINKKNNKIEFELDLESNRWAKCNIKYYVDWLIKIKGVDNDFEDEFHFNTENKRFLISFETKSLGDSLAFIPYVEKFRKERNCKVVCSTFHNQIFQKEYPEIEFVLPGTNVNNLNGLYRLGLFFENSEIDYNRHPFNPIKEPLQKIASDILGLKYKELKPKIPIYGVEKKKRVCIGIHSTSQCKYWNNKRGWQDVVNYLISKGYEVRLLSKEEDGYMGNFNPKGVKQQPPSDLNEIIKVIQESEFFIGVSSGLSWLAWGCNIPVILISGFTDVYLEPMNGIHRIINKNVCNSCWHDFKFDPGDWYWCPVHKGTDKQFECSNEITSENVISIIKNLN